MQESFVRTCPVLISKTAMKTMDVANDFEKLSFENVFLEDKKRNNVAVARQ